MASSSLSSASASAALKSTSSPARTKKETFGFRDTTVQSDMTTTDDYNRRRRLPRSRIMSENCNGAAMHVRFQAMLAFFAHGDVGKGCAFASRGAGARALFSDIDSICAPQACTEGFQVVRMDDVVGEVDIFTSTNCNIDIVTLAHMRNMKNNAIVGNIGHFDNEIDMAGLEGFPGSRLRTLSLRSTAT